MADEYEFKEDMVVPREGKGALQFQKGARIPMTEARALGLVKDSQKAGPSETKEEAPSETKAKKK